MTRLSLSTPCVKTGFLPSKIPLPVQTLVASPGLLVSALAKVRNSAHAELRPETLIEFFDFSVRGLLCFRW
jgi:hypothetical protein